MSSPSRRDQTRAERVLVAQLARQDPEAAAGIQAEFGGVLKGYLRHLLGDEWAAEDVLQRVLLEAWRGGPSFDPARGSLLSWLMTIARSRAIDALRRRVPEPHDPTSSTLLERAGEVEDHAEAVAAQWQLTYLLSLLSPQQAELLRMRFQLGLSQTEIAEQTGIALGTIKTRMAGALERLRTLMGEQT